jgi:uncharacterized damage-inducible protein DinB
VDNRYPVGTFSRPDTVDAATRSAAVDEIARAPAALRAAVAGLTASQLDTPYRDGGWTVRQVAHHVPDSHVNAYIRTKLALTETEPTIKPYEEAEWAKLPDTTATPVDTALAMLDAVHTRWLAILRGMDAAAWRRPFRHPESGVWRIEQLVTLYAWHGKHHVAHITNLRSRMGW